MCACVCVCVYVCRRGVVTQVEHYSHAGYIKWTSKINFSYFDNGGTDRDNTGWLKYKD